MPDLPMYDKSLLSLNDFRANLQADAKRRNLRSKQSCKKSSLTSSVFRCAHLKGLRPLTRQSIDRAISIDAVPDTLSLKTWIGPVHGSFSYLPLRQTAFSSTKPSDDRARRCCRIPKSLNPPSINAHPQTGATTYLVLGVCAIH
jgi:hypothetical protein